MFNITHSHIKVCVNQNCEKWVDTIEVIFSICNDKWLRQGCRRDFWFPKVDISETKVLENSVIPYYNYLVIKRDNLFPVVKNLHVSICRNPNSTFTPPEMDGKINTPLHLKSPRLSGRRHNGFPLRKFTEKIWT